MIFESIQLDRIQSEVDDQQTRSVLQKMEALHERVRFFRHHFDNETGFSSRTVAFGTNWTTNVECQTISCRFGKEFDREN